MSSLDELQQTIQNLYYKNITFLKNNHIDIYNKIVEFEKKEQERFFLDFQNAHFDIVDEKDLAVYRCDPYYDAQYRAENIYNTKSYFKLIELEKSKRTIQEYTIIANKFFNQYIDITKQLDNESNITIDKMIFIGTLLGVHITEILNTVNCKSCLIIEPNIEIFRLSLMINDYSRLNCENTIFLIAFDENEFDQKIKLFLKNNVQYNNIIKFELASEKELYLIDKIAGYFVVNSQYRYPFSEYLEQYNRSVYYTHKNYNVLSIKKTLQSLQDKPVLYLGAGPSLGKNIEFVKKNQNSFLIVAISATLKRLETEGIVPDVIITVDGGPLAPLKQFEVDKKYYENAIILASIQTHFKLIEKIISDKLFLFQTSFVIHTDSISIQGTTVSEIGYALLLEMGFNHIYLLGIDASLNSSGYTHDDTHYSNSKYELKEIDTIENNGIESESQLVKVKGNFQEIVFSNYHFKLIIDNFESINKNKRFDDIKVFNLSDGAFLYGCIPLKTANIKDSKTIAKQKLLVDMYDYLTSQSIRGFSDNDKKQIQEELECIKVIQAASDSQKRFYELYLQRKELLILQIIDRFYQETLPYINYIKSKNISTKEYNHLMVIKKEQEKEVFQKCRDILEKKL